MTDPCTTYNSSGPSTETRSMINTIHSPAQCSHISPVLCVSLRASNDCVQGGPVTLVSCWYSGVLHHLTRVTSRGTADEGKGTAPDERRTASREAARFPPPAANGGAQQPKLGAASGESPQSTSSSNAEGCRNPCFSMCECRISTMAVSELTSIVYARRNDSPLF